MREFHMIIKSANGQVVHRKLDVNDGITLQPTDTIIYSEMDDVDTGTLMIHADGTASSNPEA